MKNTDNDWEALAQRDPYWAVLSSQQFLNCNLTDHARRQFFQTGLDHINRVHRTLRDIFGAPPKFDTSLDFGCGVGRLLFGLARISKLALGVEVSETMRQLCAQNAEDLQVGNIEVYPSSPDLTEFDRYSGKLDIVTSYIVLQHIPTDRGVRYIHHLAKLLKPGGYGYIHFPIAENISNLPKESGYTTGGRYGYYQRLGPHLLRLAEVVENEDPLIMQMNHYNLNEVLCVLSTLGVTSVHVQLADRDSFLSAELFFRMGR